MSQEHGSIVGDMMPLEICVEKELWSRNLRFYMRRVIVGVSVDIAQPITFKTESIDRVDEINNPTFELGVKQAQRLMDELWRCGLRPSEGSGSAGALAATQRHLEDMRSLVFKGEKP